MTTHSDLRETALVEDVLSAVRSEVEEAILLPFTADGTRENELLFFFKPECFLRKTADQSSRILRMALSKFARFEAEITGAYMVSGPRLERERTMDRHYGFINEVSRAGSSLLPEEEKVILRKESGAGAEARVLGGHELLHEAEDLDETMLENLWASKKSKRLRSGLYFESYNVNGETVVLVNGFHPAQLRHFTDADRRLVIFLLRSNMPWKVLRGLMLGDTFPERAAQGSLRRTLFDDPKRFGFQKVSIANNASHLSAGPFESMFEQVNFLSSSRVLTFDVDQTLMWRHSRRLGVPDPTIRGALSNPTVMVEGAERSLFDLTEEVDSRPASNLFRAFFASTSILP